MKLFEMKHIKKSFDGLEVLKDISLDVEEGEVLSIIGPSGSGKSTILRCATGLETPDSGEIIKNGDVGLVFQQFNLFPHFSVLKNITDAPIRVQKRKKEEVTGVLVVCEGGDDKNLVAYITDAINGLLGVPVHKIKVMKMSE